jgi:nitronate monooxygenase
LAGGDIDGGIWTAGMVMGLINDIPTCDVLLKRIVREAREAVEMRMRALLE